MYYTSYLSHWYQWFSLVLFFNYLFSVCSSGSMSWDWPDASLALQSQSCKWSILPCSLHSWLFQASHSQSERMLTLILVEWRRQIHDYCWFYVGPLILLISGLGRSFMCSHLVTKIHKGMQSGSIWSELTHQMYGWQMWPLHCMLYLCHI